MGKKFDIHEWQAKQWLKNQLNEQNDFVPDLEDDELKRSKIQQMMDKEKPKTPQDAPRGTLNNTIADLAEMYSYGEILDSLKVFYTDNDELPFAEMAKKHAKEFRDFLDNDELDENVTGTGASFNAGVGMGHFGKSNKKRKNTNSGYMGYSEPVNEQEEQPEETPADPEAVDTAMELSSQFKSLASDLKSPAGQRGFEKNEITILSDFMNQLVTAIKDGNASSLLSKLNNLVK